MFDALYSADLSEETEKKSNLTYLSWSQAWKVFKQFYPSATYKIHTNPNTGLPVFESEMGLMVHTEVEADGITYEDWMPIMDYANRAMKSFPYSVQVYDKQTKQYVEKHVEAATTFDVNSAIQRSTVKCMARHGLGLYIYNGFDHIDENGEPQQNSNNGQQNGYQQNGYQQNPYQPNGPQYGNYRAPVKNRNIALCVVLSIITCGIYGIYWLVCLVDDLNVASGRTGDTSGGMVFLLSLITCGIYGIYWLYIAGEKVAYIKQRNTGEIDSSSSVLYLILGIIGFGIVAYALIQSELNKVATLQ